MSEASAQQHLSSCPHSAELMRRIGNTSVRGLLYLHSWCMLCLKILACLLVQCVVNATDERKLLNSATAVNIIAIWMTEFSHFCCIYSNNVYSSGLFQSFMLGNMWLPTKMPPIGALKHFIKFEQNIHEWFFGVCKTFPFFRLHLWPWITKPVIRVKFSKLRFIHHLKADYIIFHWCMGCYDRTIFSWDTTIWKSGIWVQKNLIIEKIAL